MARHSCDCCIIEIFIKELYPRCKPVCNYNWNSEVHIVKVKGHQITLTREEFNDKTKWGPDDTPWKAKIREYFSRPLKK